MLFDEDIIRGVRKGALLLAALLLGVATYRILHAMVPIREDSAPEVSVPEEPPSLAVGPPMVPPPPPKPGDEPRPVRSHRVLTPAPKPLAVELETKTDPENAPPQENGTLLVPQQEPEPDGGDFEDDSSTAEDRSSRRLRWLKAVGQYIHAGDRNASQPDAVH